MNNFAGSISSLSDDDDDSDDDLVLHTLLSTARERCDKEAKVQMARGSVGFR